MRARASTLGTVLAAAMLAGCTVGPNYRPPEMTVPAAFVGPQVAAAPGASIDPARWWTAFGDPQLNGLIDRALKDNPDIAIAASRVRQARTQEIVARAAGRPTVNASANASALEFSKNAGLSTIARSFSGGDTGGGTGVGTGSGIALPGRGITTFAAGFDASWELDLFGGVRRQQESARARTEAAIWSRRDAAVTLAAEVAQAYFALRLDQVQAATIDQELIRQRRALEIAGNIAKVGLVPPIDVTRQRGSITTTEARAEPIRADIDVRMHALAILLGEPPAALMGELAAMPVRTLAVPAIPAGLPSDLLRRRPDVRAAERDLAASTADIGVAVADLYPEFSLTGVAQLISTALGNLFSGDSLQLTGSGAVQFPLVDFGRRKATVTAREEDREQAYLRYRTTVLQALRDVEDPLAQIAGERRRNAALARAVTDAQSSASALEAQYRTGFIAQDSLLNAQFDVLSAREQLAASDAQLRQLTAALFKAMGGGWAEGDDVPPRPTTTATP
ncbi:efflux transporter outer membrane subunit [Sphingomonas mollis]|uniref:Efflux transporter outer membrane subunit n=1 Tax=Sphingomonas mollis TaxID=2795726 RepID=A0ABS0XUJ5_9SPHN|nr:efflux transporter outer membrane subunit [Sphingomonas sp. BT553]MBJ6123692.1 efflux transporter outer membrane subunit [Sphingomonas sp. BT553]